MESSSFGCRRAVSPHSLAVAAGFHDNGVGDREEEEQQDFRQR